MSVAAVKYHRAQHAAHYAPAHPAIGHDLEQWDVSPSGAFPERPSSVPDSAEFHSGYLDRNGVQHWVYARRAPLSGPSCVHCPGYVAP